jgi:hypothetical protein
MRIAQNRVDFDVALAGGVTCAEKLSSRALVRFVYIDGSAFAHSTLICTA